MWLSSIKNFLRSKKNWLAVELLAAIHTFHAFSTTRIAWTFRNFVPIFLTSNLYSLIGVGIGVGAGYFVRAYFQNLLATPPEDPAEEQDADYYYGEDSDEELSDEEDSEDDLDIELIELQRDQALGYFIDPHNPALSVPPHRAPARPQEIGGHALRPRNRSFRWPF